MAAPSAESIYVKDALGYCVRWHELAVQRWLNQQFVVQHGYPIPVVFASPMDAFGYFKSLWAGANNPFAYLFELKDEHGTPIYEPFPSPPRYPLLSVFRKGWTYRASQNYSFHRQRRIAWPTVSDNVTRSDLGNVVTSRMPSAWDYKFQVDLFCLTPEFQSYFVSRLQHTMWKAGGTPQTWIVVNYPGHTGPRLVRAYIDGGIDSLTPAEPQPDRFTEYRISFSLVVEGYNVDLDYQTFPALWKLVLNTRLPATSTELDSLFSTEVDLRDAGTTGNPTLDTRANVPTA